MAQSRALTNAMRRLDRVLADEDYGPKLARLRGEDERRILERISSGDGIRSRALRDDIDAADQRRRTHARERRQRTLLQRAVDNVLQQHRHRPRTSEQGIRRNLSAATQRELTFAERATHDELVVRARERPRDVEGYEINPFWYH